MWGELTPEERQAREAALRSILAGRPTLAEIGIRLRASAGAVATALAALEAKGFLVRDAVTGEIKAAYPLSVSPTRHRVTLTTGEQAHALCAVDALGVAGLFGVASRIETACPTCGCMIHLAVSDGHIQASDPPGIVVWYSSPALLTQRVEGLNLVEVHCPSTNFFCTEEEARRWGACQENADGIVLSLEQAMNRAREVFAGF